MAAIKINGEKVKSKPKKERVPLSADEKYTGLEPVWDAERAKSMSSEEFDHRLRQSFYYYNYYYTTKALKHHVMAWIRGVKDYSKEDVKAFEAAYETTIPITFCSLIMAHRKGMPFRERHLEFIADCVQKAVQKGKGLGPQALTASNLTDEQKAAAKEAPKPTIQDRLAEKTSDQIGELEGHYDEVLVGASKFKHYDFLVANNIPQSQLAKFKDAFMARQFELVAAKSKEDRDLVEGYKHFKTTDFTRILAWIEALMEAIEQYRGVKKATKKVRAPRAVSKEKQVAKVKFLKEEKTLKLVSVNPADILGASELWIYNVRTRKLGKYVADSLSVTLGIRGTTIVGFDPTKSVSKTIRKPEEKLKEFARASKVQLRKFLDDIRATETRMNGRLNEDTILLKVL
jgi:hypothetical protein